MLDGGYWNGQQIVPADYAAASVENHVDLGWLEPDAWDWDLVGYGYQWWIGAFEVGSVRYDSFAARGNGEQTVMVVPALDLVIAVNARLYDSQDDDRNQVFRMMRGGILPAFAVE